MEKHSEFQQGPGLDLEIEDANPELFPVEGDKRPSKAVEGDEGLFTTIQGKRIYLEDLHGK